MKRVSLVILALCLVLALCSGCANKNETPDDSDAVQPVESNEPDSKPDDKPDDTPKEEPKKCAFVPLTVGTEFFQAMADMFVAQFTAAGYEADYASADADPAKQIEVIENYVAMGYDLIVVYPVSGEGLSTAIKNAQDAGVKVVVMVNETETYDAVLRAAGAKIVKAMQEMAADWVEERFPDAEDRSVKCALITHTATSTMAEYSEIVQDIEEYSDKIVVDIVYEVTEDTSAAGQAAAENIYTTNPDINLFLSVTGTVAYGINNYYTALNCPVDDLSTIGVFGVNGSMESYAAVKASGNDEAVLRGIASVAGLQATVAEMVELADLLFADALENPERDGKIDKITVANVDEFIV